MALDYKTLQAMAASQPTNVTPFCPECGRPWIAPSPERPRLAAPFPWRAVFLAVMGLALALTFGWRAARASQREAAIQGDIAALTTCLGGATVALTCTPFDNQAGWLRVSFDNRDAARGQRDRALAAAALGLLALGVGLGSVVRRPPRVRPHCRAWPTVTAAWGLVEVMLALACLQVLALSGVPVALHAARGFPVSWDTFDRATDGVLLLFSLASGP